VFEEVIFSSNIIKTLESTRDGAWKKEGKRKASRVYSNQWGSQYFQRRKTLQLQKSFLMWFHFLPHHHTISKTLFKIIKKVFLTLFDHAFAWQYTWLELYHFPLAMSSTYLAFRG
jgi:hypothetical protein